MQKRKLAICINNEIYQERFVKCLMNHYRDKYELHVFKTLTELTSQNDRQYDGFLLGDWKLQEYGWCEENKEKTLILNEENKYQEVFKIVEALEILLGNSKLEDWKSAEMQKKVIGIYSLTVPHLQLPLGATLASILGEQNKAILLDFQANSGFIAAQGTENPQLEMQLGMEDVMAIAISGSHTKGRLLSAISHHQSWDFVYPVKNSSCLQEATAEVIENIIDLLSSQLEYQTIIVNIGASVTELDKVIALCDSCFLLYPKGNAGVWREKQMLKEMERRGKEDVFHRIHRMEVPSISSGDGGWEKVAEQWKWGNIGDALRKIVMEENVLGQAM